ncbi:phage gp6-like head-tail connector protein [Lacticaseibacillus suibinensis]|uniref:phage gp6-like head-tail connector protein n=1 Tax=Lacticaseibacillus suibinensis TaxID=2486011 RepID=UPI000F78E03F|nr:phage gp6-like head-tail connector protein [Lacticaseibacillus suibinensis]
MAGLDKLSLLKANLGITSDTRDPYLQSILASVETELNASGVTVLDEDNPAIMLQIDYAAWRFRNRGEGTMPRNIQYRLHNLMVGQVGVYD